MTKEEMFTVIRSAVTDLQKAGSALEEATVPQTNMPRPRIFEITDSITWPYIATDENKIYWQNIQVGARRGLYYISTGDVSRYIGDTCGWEPRKVLRAVRRLQAAAAWCRARADGRQRMAQEIVRQQSRAVEKLKAELTVVLLSQNRS